MTRINKVKILIWLRWENFRSNIYVKQNKGKNYFGKFWKIKIHCWGTNIHCWALKLYTGALKFGCQRIPLDPLVHSCQDFCHQFDFGVWVSIGHHDKCQLRSEVSHFLSLELVTFDWLAQIEVNNIFEYKMWNVI